MKVIVPLLSAILLPLSAMAQDETPPSAPQGLEVASVTANTVTLRWVAPGGDGLAGAAAIYDLRLSLTGAGNFDSAIPVVGEPAPAIFGTVQTMTVTGLTGGRTCSFALRAADGSGNWGPATSFVTTSTLPSVDSEGPAACADLRVVAAGQDWLTVEWTASGDNGLAGTAAHYDLRWSAGPIGTENEFLAAAGGVAPHPAASGTTQRATLAGLPSGASVTVALRAADGSFNWSPIAAITAGTLVRPVGSGVKALLPPGVSPAPTDDDSNNDGSGLCQNSSIASGLRPAGALLALLAVLSGLAWFARKS